MVIIHRIHKVMLVQTITSRLLTLILKSGIKQGQVCTALLTWALYGRASRPHGAAPTAEIQSCFMTRLPTVGSSASFRCPVPPSMHSSSLYHKLPTLQVPGTGMFFSLVQICLTILSLVFGRMGIID